MIEALLGLRNEQLALCKCDYCATEIQMRARFGDTGSSGRVPEMRRYSLHNPAAVIEKLKQDGWSYIKNGLRCPACEAKRKPAIIKEVPMAQKPQVVTVIRQPTREQKRQIIELLTEFYDVKAERYKGAETDITIADTIGGGCMFGWVAAIREDMFGPDGGNEEHEKLTADIAQWRANADKLAGEVAATLREFNDCRTKVKDMADRLAIVVKAAGPRAKGAA